MTRLRSRLRRLAERHVGGTAAVLIYHRVASLERDPQLLGVSPRHFDEQMAMLRERFEVLSLESLLEGLERRRLPRRAVAVTFDDGYADNLRAAEPVLRARDVPATVFVSSGYVTSQREYWWDELEKLVLEPGTLPERLVIGTPGGQFAWSLSANASYAKDQAERDSAWTVLDAATNDRHQLYLALHAFLRPLPPNDRENALVHLREAAAMPAEARPSHRPLSEHELAMLDASPVVTIGGHTSDHALLAALSPAEQASQIGEDRDHLVELLGHQPVCFSYPYGGLDDYSATSVDLVRAAGYTGACSNHPGIVKPWTDPYRLPRHLVRDWDGEQLASELDALFDGRR